MNNPVAIRSGKVEGSKFSSFHNAFFLWLPLLLLSLLLSACTTTNDNVQPAVEADAEPPAPAYVPQADLTPPRRLLLALEQLEQGLAQPARIELSQLLLQRPDNRTARRLIEQIDTPAGAFFPERYIEKQLEPGESLSTISRDYLGDLYSFYALAKYNGIEIPAKINSGQTIRIPATPEALARASARAAQADKETPIPDPTRDDTAASSSSSPSSSSSESTDTTAVSQTDTAFSEADSDNPIAAPESAPEDVPETTPAPAQVVEEPLSQLAQLDRSIARGEYDRAATLLEEIDGSEGLNAQLEPRVLQIYPKGAESVAADNPQLAASRYHRVARLHLRRGAWEKALPAFRRSVELDPGNQQVAREYVGLKEEWSGKYHKQATEAYRKQELDRAIQLWTRVLEIDPEHSAAQAYLVQARDLKKKLSKLQQQ